VYTGERADVFAGRDVIHADGVPVAVGTEHVLGADGRRQPHHLVVIVQDRHGRHQGRAGVRQRWVGVREGRASRPGPGEGPAARWSEARQAAARTSRTTPCTSCALQVHSLTHSLTHSLIYLLTYHSMHCWTNGSTYLGYDSTRQNFTMR